MKDTKTKKWLSVLVAVLVIAGMFASVANSKIQLYRGLQPLTPPADIVARATYSAALATQASVLAVDFAKIIQENSERLLKVVPRAAVEEVSPLQKPIVEQTKVRQTQRPAPGPKVPPTQADPGPKIKIIK